MYVIRGKVKRMNQRKYEFYLSRQYQMSFIREGVIYQKRCYDESVLIREKLIGYQKKKWEKGLDII